MKRFNPANGIAYKPWKRTGKISMAQRAAIAAANKRRSKIKEEENDKKD